MSLFKSKVCIFFVCLSTAFLGILLLNYSKEISKTVSDSITLCLSVLIPSLFTFMVFSNFLLESNIYMYLGRPFDLFSRYILKLPTKYFSIFILSNLAGYPVGIKLITKLKYNKEISKKFANNLICSCFCSGPSFIINIIGIKLFCSKKIGILIYISIFLANLFLAVILNFKNSVPPKEKINSKINISSKVFINSIDFAVRALLTVCSMLIIFSVFICICNESGLSEIIINSVSNIFSLRTNTSSQIFESFLEVTHISFFETNNYNLLPIITAITACGGLCVLFQVSYFNNNILNLKKFYLTRPLQICLSSILSVLIIKLYINHTIIDTCVIPEVSTKNSSCLPGIIIIFMSCFILLINNSRLYRKGMLE